MVRTTENGWGRTRESLRRVVPLLRRTVATLRATSPASLVVAILPHATFHFGSVLVERMLPVGADAGTALLWAVAIVAFAVAYVGAVLLVSGVLARMHDDLLRTRRFDPVEATELVAPKFRKLAATATVYFALALLGLLVLVPGILVLVSGFLFVQVVLFEYRAPAEALRRSRDLLRGRRITVGLAASAILGVAATLALVALALDARLALVAALLLTVAGAGAQALLAALSAIVYRDAFDGERVEAARVRETPEAEGVRYVCPRCGREYALPRAPPPGTYCPRCRDETGQTSGSA